MSTANNLTIIITAIASNDYPLFDAWEQRSSVATLYVGRRWAGRRGGGSQSFPWSLLALYGAMDTCGDGQIPNKMSGIDLQRNF